jgi:signal transduction histidine kinase
LTVIILLVEVLLVFNPIIKAIIDKSRKLEESIESKNRILATIVHDLRNPLNGIKGLNNILKDDLTEQLTDDQMEMFSLIDESTEKANHLIEELLEISELEGEDFELERKEVRLSEYLEKSIKPFQNKAKEKGVELSISTMGNGLAVNIDPKRFERVISNLLSNALKFTSDNGRVSVELKEKEKESVIVISDTGVGIPEKVQPYIFDKFSKARRLGLEGEQSTGLGMSIVQQIVHLHQGEIWVESEENKGTTFYISLPKAS